MAKKGYNAQSVQPRHAYIPPDVKALGKPGEIIAQAMRGEIVGRTRAMNPKKKAEPEKKGKRR